METNPIFNIKRFTGLFGVGLNRRKIHFLSVLYWFSVILYLIQFLVTNGARDESGKSEFFFGRIFQFGYVVLLSILSLRGITNREKIAVWTLIPASAFEKYLCRFIINIVFGSIIYFAAIWIIQLVLNGTPDYTVLKQILTTAQFAPSIPSWLCYTLSLFYLLFVPIVISLDFGYTTNTHLMIPMTAWLLAMMYLSFPSTSALSTQEAQQSTNLILTVFVAFCSFCAFLYGLLNTLIKSYRSGK